MTKTAQNRHHALLDAKESHHVYVWYIVGKVLTISCIKYYDKLSDYDLWMN